jgi:hypothetical protein
VRPRHPARRRALQRVGACDDRPPLPAVVPLGHGDGGPPGRGRERQQRLVGLGAATGHPVRRPERRRLRPLPPLPRGRRRAGGAGAEHLPVLRRVGADRARGRRHRAGRARPLPADDRRGARGGPDADGDAAPLHSPPLGRAPRRVDGRQHAGPVRPLLRHRGAGAGRSGRMVLHDQRAGGRGVRRLPRGPRLPAGHARRRVVGAGDHRARRRRGWAQLTRCRSGSRTRAVAR